LLWRAADLQHGLNRGSLLAGFLRGGFTWWRGHVGRDSVANMKRSSKLNLAAVVAGIVAVVLFSLELGWPTVAVAIIAAGFAIAAGRAMQTEPRTPSRDGDEDR